MMPAEWSATGNLAALATGRHTSLFQADYDAHADGLADRLRDARVLVIGGAGSIGGSVVKLLAAFETRALHVLDSNENALVELTRDLRASPRAPRARELRWLPLDFGSAVTIRFLTSEPPFDVVLNFAAVKHVRSEKDVYSVLRMLDVNVLQQDALLRLLATRSQSTAYFSVSTDKAANPVNLMGATKRLMEHVMFGGRHGLTGPVTSARFANVAFSDGSLLHGWLHRVAKAQPLAVPRDTRRYFVSMAEAGELCMLAAFCLENRHILVPRLAPDRDLRLLEVIAADFVRHLGLEPAIYHDEDEARAAVDRDRRRGRYPVLLTPLDTTGEKAFEEFAGAGEQAVEAGFLGLQRIAAAPPRHEELEAVVGELRRLVSDPATLTSKHEVVEIIRRVVPEFAHAEMHRGLDDRV